MKIKMIPLVAAIGCMFAAMATPALAHEFIQKQVKSGYVSKGGVQTFVTNIAKIECASEKGSGSNSGEEKSERAFAAATYEGCKAAGFKAVKITPALYTYRANGTMAVESAIVATLEPALVGKCEITVNPTGNKELKAVTYSNNIPGITTKAAVEGITYEVKETEAGGVCGKTGGSNGTYKGETKTETFTKGTLACVAYVGGDYKNDVCNQNGPPLWYAFVASYETLEFL